MWSWRTPEWGEYASDAIRFVVNCFLEVKCVVKTFAKCGKYVLVWTYGMSVLVKWYCDWCIGTGVFFEDGRGAVDCVIAGGDDGVEVAVVMGCVSVVDWKALVNS